MTAEAVKPGDSKLGAAVRWIVVGLMVVVSLMVMGSVFVGCPKQSELPRETLPAIEASPAPLPSPPAPSIGGKGQLR